MFHAPIPTESLPIGEFRGEMENIIPVDPYF
jgi:hypothetical protein